MLTKERLQSNMKEFLKSGDKERLSVARMLFTEVRNAEINDIASPGRVRTEEESMAIVQSYYKSMAKTLTEYPIDRQPPLQAELLLIAEYLPKQMSRDEIQTGIRNQLKETPERNFGVLMKLFQAQFVGVANGKVISEIVKAELATHAGPLGATTTSPVRG